ncbi:MAG: hypothetical protein ACJZ4Z_02945 [Candidatus Thalassarchaeaceae archaeon]
MKVKAILIVTIMVLSILPYTPEAMLKSNKEPSFQASNADVAVTQLDITTPSVYVGAVPTVSPMNHIIRVTIVNFGGSDAEGTLSLIVDDGSGPSEVDSRDISISSGWTSNHVMYWNATNSPSGSSLNASWTNDPSSTDSDSSNNHLILSNIDVLDVQSATHVADTLPNNGDVLAKGLWSGTISMVNSGTIPVDVTADLSLTSAIGGDVTPITSTTTQLPVGSLSSPALLTNIEISFDGTPLEGEYIISGEIQVTGALSGTSTISISDISVTFDFSNAVLSTPIDRNVDPGEWTNISFLLQNAGSLTETFVVSHTNVSGWVQAPSVLHAVSSPLSLASGASTVITIPVQVPPDADISDSEMVTLSVLSQSNNLLLESTVIVMAGELFQGTITQNSSHTSGVDHFNVEPGGESFTHEYILNNTGTAPAQYEINVAMLEAVPYWTIISPVTITNILLPGENITIPVTFILPDMEIPLQSALKINADLELTFRVQAIPLSGGLDVIATTSIHVLPKVEIDFELLDDNDEPLDADCPLNIAFEVCLEDVTSEEITSLSVNRALKFRVQAKNNLASETDGTAQISLVQKLLVHDPFTTGAAQYEEERWTIGLSPSTMSLGVGATGYGVITMRHTSNVNFPYPAAGELSFTVAAETTFTLGNYNGNTIQTSNNSTSISFDIPQISEAGLISKTIGTGAPGTSIVAEMTLKNMGNSPDIFDLNYDPLPGWTVSISSTTTIKSRIEGFCGQGSSCVVPYETSFTVSAVPPATASAEKIHEIVIYACTKRDPGVCDYEHEPETEQAEILTFATAKFQLDELIDANLNTGSDLAILDRLGTSTIMFELNNTGNSNQTFVLNLQNTDDDYLFITFNEDDSILELTKSMLVPPGATSIVRVYAKASDTARADRSTTFDIELTNNGSFLDSKTMEVTVNPDHALNLQGSTSYFAQPGDTINTDFNLINLGNLLESNVSFIPILPTDSSSGLWSFETENENVSLEPGSENSLAVILNFTLPNLGPDVMLEAGTVFNIPIKIFSYDFTDINGDYLTLGLANIAITIEPYFKLIITSSSDYMNMVPGQTRTFDYTIQNGGNAPARVSMSSELSVTEQSRWQVSYPNLPSTQFIIQIEESYSITLEITPIASDHYVGESGTFDIIFTSDDDAEESTSFSTPIEIVRIQTDDTIIIDTGAVSTWDDGLLTCEENEGDRCRILRIPWMHVPHLGQTDESSAVYNLTLLSFSRDITTDQNEQAIWQFFVNDELLSSDFTGINFLPVQPYDSDTTFDFKFILPLTDELAVDDGYEFTFRLKNLGDPEDIAQYWTDFTIDLNTTNTSDPMILEMRFLDSQLIEGESATLVVEVKNAGDAVLPSGSEISVYCSGKYLNIFASGSQNIPQLAAQETFESTWQISSKSIPWWSTGEPITCNAQLTGSIVELKGNDISNDIRSQELNVLSWEPPSYLVKIGNENIKVPLMAFVSIILLFASIYLYRNGLRDFTPSYVLLSSYFATASLGALALTNWFTWLPIICASLAIFISIKIAWTASSELQAIYNDKRKSLTGARATISNHDAEAIKTFRELRAIVSCAPLTFLLFTIIEPNLALDTSTSGLTGLLLYILASPLIIHLVLRFLDRSYEKIYGDLGQLEIKAMKIKKILASQKTSNRFQPKNRIGGPE